MKREEYETLKLKNNLYFKYEIKTGGFHIKISLHRDLLDF